MASMKENLKKAVSKIAGASTDSATPKFWISSGNYCINKIMSGNWMRAVPQGRITMFSGPSGCGKSFIIGNVIKQALADGFFVVAIDSENALDDEYLQAIGVDTTSDDYFYCSVKNMSSGSKTFQSVTKGYNEALLNGKIDELPKVLIVIDSLDFLFVDGMLEEYEKTGEMGSDQGLHAKKLRQLLNLIISDIKYIPVAVLVTKQVYVDQTKYASPPWKMAESIKYAVSQLMLITRLLDKNDKTKEITGIKMKVFGWKTRFTKPFQQVEIVVPYDTGLNPYEGLLQVAKTLEIVTVSGSYLVFEGEKFYSKNFPDFQERIFTKIKEFKNLQIDAISEDVVEEAVPEKKAKALAKKKVETLVALGKMVPGDDDHDLPPE